MRKYANYTEWGQDDAIGDDTFHDQWEALEEDRFLVGTPANVVDEIERYRNAMDLDELFVRMQFPGMDLADIRSSIELFGDEVIPHLA
jgi:alkanesulfonate monooxygenase SsuD/methylene tetrahydromethanopterin reductase-like flavin-dependent oxidoreductase (luciferase family)